MTILNPRMRIEDNTSSSIFTVKYSLTYNYRKREPRCIRYFNNQEKAEQAKEVLISEGFEAEVKEDKFGTLTLDRLGLPLRFKLYVERDEIKKIARVLASKLKP